MTVLRKSVSVVGARLPPSFLFDLLRSSVPPLPQSRLGELEVLLVMEPYLLSRFLDRPNREQDLQHFSKLYRELF